MNKEKIKSFLESKSFKAVMYTLGIIAVIFIIFHAGMMAGFRKASFGRDWGNNYNMNFGTPRMGPKMMGGEFGEFGNLPNAHGSVGEIIKIELPTIIVLDDKDQTEKVIKTDEDTNIQKMREDVLVKDLKVGDHVVVIGSPNSQGQIEAKLIRLLLAPLDKPLIKN